LPRETPVRPRGQELRDPNPVTSVAPDSPDRSAATVTHREPFRQQPPRNPWSIHARRQLKLTSGANHGELSVNDEATRHSQSAAEFPRGASPFQDLSSAPLAHPPFAGDCAVTGGSRPGLMAAVWGGARKCSAGSCSASSAHLRSATETQRHARAQPRAAASGIRMLRPPDNYRDHQLLPATRLHHFPAA
jgi:hypothetical protein